MSAVILQFSHGQRGVVANTQRSFREAVGVAPRPLTPLTAEARNKAVAGSIPAADPLDFANWLLKQVIDGEISLELAHQIYDRTEVA